MTILARFQPEILTLLRPARFLNIIVFLSLVLLACRSAQDIYKQEAREFCEIHNPDYWREFNKNATPEELQSALNAKVDTVVKSKAFKNVVAELEQVRFLRELYNTAQTKISQLTGETWNCPYYIAFYSVSFQRVPEDNAPEDITKENIIVGVDKNGNYTLNERKLKDNKSETLKTAIKSLNGVVPPRIVVKTDKNTSKDKLDSLFRALYKMGVKKLTMLVSD